MVEKLKNGFFKLKSYWKKPPRGYDVSYKEFLFFTIGSGGMSFLSVLVSATTIAINATYIMQAFKLTPGSAFILSTVLGSIIALIRAPILSMILDNSNDKKGNGKFKPLLMWSAIVSAICFVFIPFVPTIWINTVAITFNIPAIPILGVISAQTVNLSIGLIVAFVLIQVGLFFYTLFSQAMIGIEQTISTVAQERANIMSLKGVISNIPSSVINLAAPIIAGIFFGGSLTNLNVYKITFPISAIGGILLLLFMKPVKERVVVNKEYKAKVKFSEGAKALSKNKYFWIITIFNVAVGIRSMSNIVSWIQMSYAEGDPLKTIVGIFNTTILMSILIVGMATAPIFIKKFGKKKLLIFSSIGFALMVVVQIAFYQSRIMILLACLLQNVFGGFAFVGGVMVTDVLDYEQWKTGKRLEGFWQNYSGFIGTILGIFTGALLPIFLNLAGVEFGRETEDFLNDLSVRDKAFFFATLLGLIGSVICIIPLLFYDLDEKKHANIIKSLKLRAAVENYKNNELTDDDVINVCNILSYKDRTNNEFLATEFAKFDCIDAIIATKDESFAREAAKARQEAILDLQRDMEFDYKKIYAKTAIAEKKATKKGLTFNAEAHITELKHKSRFFKYFFDGELNKYLDMDINDVFAEIETVYDLYFAITSGEARVRDVATFKTRLDKEHMRMTASFEKAKQSATKKGKSFDAEITVADIKAKSRYFKYFANPALSSYESIDVILADIEQVYDIYSKIDKD